MDRRAVVIFGICAAPRLLAMARWPTPVPTYYTELATGLLATGNFGFDGAPSTYLEPLYPAVLAAARLLTADSAPTVTLLQIALASIGGVLLYRLASHLAGPRAGFCAGVLYALYPYLVRQSVTRNEVTVCTTLAIAATLALVRTERLRGAIGTGVLFGLLTLTRTTFVVATIGAALWLLYRGRPSTSSGTRGRLSVVMLVTALAVEVPWLARNIRVDGSPLPSRLGENLYVSTSAYAAPVPVHDIDVLAPLALAEIERRVFTPGQEERLMDDEMLSRAVVFIRDHPGGVLWLKARNALHLLNPLLLPRYAKAPASFAVMEGTTVRVVNPVRRHWLKDVAHGLAQSGLLLLAAVGIAGRRTPAADAPLLIMLGAQAAVCIVFFPTTRLMAPVMFVVMFYAAAGLTSSSAAARRRR